MTEMATFSFDGWLSLMFTKYNPQIRTFAWFSFYLLIIGFTGLFIKVGFDYSSGTNVSLIKTLLYGILIAVLGVVLFFVAHFSGGIDVDVKWLGLPLGLAIGGATIGLVGGFYNSIASWIFGFTIGSLIIVLTVRIYLQKVRK